MYNITMYGYNLIAKTRILWPLSSLRCVKYTSMSFYEVKGPKHTSKHDYSEDIDSFDKVENIQRPGTLVEVLKSPEYQVLRASTPAPMAVLNSFYSYSPLARPKAMENLKFDGFGRVDLVGYHKLADFLWHLGINNILDKSEIERFSQNFSIADLSVDDAIKMILVFEGLKGPLNVCSLVMYEYLFHDKPITTEQLLSLAYALGKVRHSIDTLILPLVAILHKSSLKLEERIKLFLAVSRLEPNINLIEFYTFSIEELAEVDKINSLFKIINMYRWERDIKREGYIDCYNPTDYPVNCTSLQIFQLINGLSNISLDWIIGSVHKRIELKRLWNSNAGNEVEYQDQIFSYRNPLMSFCKILLDCLNKLEFNIVGFYIIDTNLKDLPMHGVSLAHVLSLIDQMGDLGEEISHYGNISSLVQKLTPSSVLDIVEFIKIIKNSHNTVIVTLESFITNMEKKYDISQNEYNGEAYRALSQKSIDSLNDLNEVIRNMVNSNGDLKDKLSKTFDKIKYISHKAHLD